MDIATLMILIPTILIPGMAFAEPEYPKGLVASGLLLADMHATPSLGCTGQPNAPIKYTSAMQCNAREAIYLEPAKTNPVVLF